MAETTTTLETASSEGGTQSGDPRPLDALAIVWSADEPSRIGEVVLFPPAAERRSFVFGRGDETDGRHERAVLVRQRPGETLATPPLTSHHLSRSQIFVRCHPDGGLALENVGKRTLVVAGKEIQEGRARPGDLVELGHQMLLLCLRRPSTLPALRATHEPPSFLFGEADAFGYVGESPEAWNLRDEVALLARRREHVLVLGASGTGKELVAQALHALGPRAGRRFVTRNAATVPSGLIDAELFGNTANYPNAGMAERAGLVGEADGSTLFLDEIGELPVELQTHLLRLLDGGDYQRLGDARRRKADLRVIGATNRPLGQLKTDLAARFALRVRTPGLHERREDVTLVARHVLRELARRGEEGMGRHLITRGEPRISRELAIALMMSAYTTHVRELSIALFRAALESRGDVVDLTSGARELLEPSGEDAAHGSREPSREAIVEALARHAGVREKVWRELGLANRYALKRLIKKYGLGDD
jgi:DNA-binding NtrC family response regulator